VVLSTAIFSLGYLFLAPDTPFIYYNVHYVNGYVYQIPLSMLQNTISKTDIQGTVNALHWFRDNTNSSALLLTHTVFYSWAIQNVNADRVRYYEFHDPLEAAANATSEGYSQVYLIWWISGQSWYGQPTLPSSLHQVFESGKIAVYSYNATA
jgi:hypothetical protein